MIIYKQSSILKYFKLKAKALFLNYMGIHKYFDISTIQVTDILEYTYILKYLSIYVKRYIYLSMIVNQNSYYIIVFKYDQIHKILDYT